MSLDELDRIIKDEEAAINAILRSEADREAVPALPCEKKDYNSLHS